jgi:uncharacterized protein (TIGR02284 family)
VTRPETGPLSSDLDDIASRLNQLIQICKDGESGFRTCAEAVQDQNLRRLFESYSQQRAELAAELQLEVRRLARDPADTGHMTAAVHRTWIDLKGTLTGTDDAVVIAEAERGEDQAVEAYQDALSSDLPGELRTVVERQFMEIKQAHDHIRLLEQAHRRPG